MDLSLLLPSLSKRRRVMSFISSLSVPPVILCTRFSECTALVGLEEGIHDGINAFLGKVHDLVGHQREQRRDDKCATGR